MKTTTLETVGTDLTVNFARPRRSQTKAGQRFNVSTPLFAILLALLFHAGAVHAQMMGPGGPFFPHNSGSSDGGSSHGNSSGSGQKNDGAWIPSEPLDSGPVGTNGIELSLQNANIDMVIQWLAQTTGKAVLKSPNVQCQVTIASPHKVTKRQAINLVYSALALQGYTVVEDSGSILIVPKGEEAFRREESG
jgi:hypothetical protein